jgi:hypothetical protein
VIQAQRSVYRSLKLIVPVRNHRTGIPADQPRAAAAEKVFQRLGDAAGFPVRLDEPLDGIDNHFGRNYFIRYQIQPLRRSRAARAEAERQ